MDKSNLQKLIDENKSIYDIAKEVGKSYTSVRYWLKKYDLKTNFVPFSENPSPLKRVKSEKYTDKEIQDAVKKSQCYADVFRFLQGSVNAGSYNWLKNIIARANADTGHFLSRGELGRNGLRQLRRNPNEDDISCGKRLSTATLRSFMISKNVEHKCAICNLENWRDKPLRLDIDHIDSNAANNHISNLQYLCPNCHRQKTIDLTKNKEKTKEDFKIYKCDNCNLSTYNSTPFCNKCINDDKIWPSIEEMKDLVWKFPSSLLAKRLSVSGSAISKFCKKNNISKPPRGYWSKNKCTGEDSNL